MDNRRIEAQYRVDELADKRFGLNEILIYARGQKLMIDREIEKLVTRWRIKRPQKSRDMERLKKLNKTVGDLVRSQMGELFLMKKVAIASKETNKEIAEVQRMIKKIEDYLKGLEGLKDMWTLGSVLGGIRRKISKLEHFFSPPPTCRKCRKCKKKIRIKGVIRLK